MTGQGGVEQVEQAPEANLWFLFPLERPAL